MPSPNQTNQSQHYVEDYDYAKGSPHLRHPRLNAMLVELITRAFSSPDTDYSPRRVLEVGAGDGSLTGHLLGLGLEVTATEISEHSAKTLEARFGGNAGFSVLHDPEGNFETLSDQKFVGILFASVLHHIPNYIAALETVMDNHLELGGSLVSIQDPLWYQRCPKSIRLASELAYLSWRVTQGKMIRGLSTRLRHLWVGPGEELPGDLIEYHVVRDGVDELAIETLLSDRFAHVKIISYWSSQGAVQQWVGNRLGLHNTFALVATRFSG